MLCNDKEKTGEGTGLWVTQVGDTKFETPVEHPGVMSNR